MEGLVANCANCQIRTSHFSYTTYQRLPGNLTIIL
ncbi:MAG: hypothetical protein EZS28_038521, partial [Streblomastix strix]